MNTEELERSLQSDFDEHLKKVLEDARQDVATLQRNALEEFENHRAKLDEAFQALNSRLESPAQFEKSFAESVIEHLRLARDEGARITATAMGEAEKLTQTPSLRDGDYKKLRDSIANIKTQQTQAAILRSLVNAAADFAPRGAFFIVKNDHLIGWKVFGAEVNETTVRSIHFPLNSDTLLSDAVNSLSARSGSDGTAAENSQFLEPLSFDSPSGMIAIPLAARGRGVAVLYADGGTENTHLNIEALETLVSVAGLTVELRAASNGQPAESASQPKAAEAEQDDLPNDTNKIEYAGNVSVEVEAVPEPQPDETPTAEFAFSENNFSEASSEEVVVEAEEQVVEQASSPQRRRKADRDIDLPIEVADGERRIHSDARRFARLLVSEIKLYNESKVREGRETGEIYEVLKEAIDRSREMYDKRVQPDVASKFDYFHYELVNNLAEGEEEKLGTGYLAVKA